MTAVFPGSSALISPPGARSGPHGIHRRLLKATITDRLSQLTAVIVSDRSDRGVGMPTSRSYRDSCGIARALDVVGERWALLVVRELLLGPQRFTDLRNHLPGIATDVLSQRLRQ